MSEEQVGNRVSNFKISQCTAQFIGKFSKYCTAQGPVTD